MRLFVRAWWGHVHVRACAYTELLRLWPLRQAGSLTYMHIAPLHICAVCEAVILHTYRPLAYMLFVSVCDAVILHTDTLCFV